MLEALSFLTTVGGARPLTRRAVPWLPWVGLATGAAVGAVWWAASEVLPPAPAAAIALIADLALTGLLHVDGLADSADGLLPHLERSRRLEVMAEPTTGAFGTGAVVVALLTRWAALVALAPGVAVVAALWGAGRVVMAAALVVCPSARPGGLADRLSDAPRQPVLASVGTALVVAAALLAGQPGSVVPLLSLIAGAGVLALASRRLGGVTGDVLGASCLVVETVGLLIAAAKW